MIYGSDRSRFTEMKRGVEDKELVRPRDTLAAPGVSSRHGWTHARRFD
jgi:hypothetical protein